MAPENDHILLNAIGTLTMSVAPEVTTPFGQGQLGLIAALMYFAAAEHDRAADTVAFENREMRALFADAAKARIGLDKGLRGELAEAAESTDADLKISTLSAANAGLKTLLIRLHEHLEGQAGEKAHALEDRVWRFLRASADARELTLPELG
ncbi:MAG: hypothetical protein ACOC91_00435 [bacterium]